MPGTALVGRYERARDAHQSAVVTLVPLLAEMALESVAEVLPGAHELEVLGEINEDGVPILRIQRVLGADATVLFDVVLGHDDRAVEDMIDEVSIEYLDPLLELPATTSWARRQSIWRLPGGLRRETRNSYIPEGSLTPGTLTPVPRSAADRGG